MEQRSIGPFTTHVTYRRSDGSTVEWSSRAHRKHASRLSRPRRRELVHWAPAPGVVVDRRAVHRRMGTLFFNATTFRALQTGIESPSYDRLVWRPDALGSICFLVSGYLAYVEVSGHLLGRPRRTLESVIATVNLLGCLAFGVSAVASYVVPATGDERNLPVVNTFTALGALCFLIGAVLLLPEGARASASEA